MVSSDPLYLRISLLVTVASLVSVITLISIATGPRTYEWGVCLALWCSSRDAIRIWSTCLSTPLISSVLRRSKRSLSYHLFELNTMFPLLLLFGFWGTFLAAIKVGQPIAGYSFEFTRNTRFAFSCLSMGEVLYRDHVSFRYSGTSQWRNH